MARFSLKRLRRIAARAKSSASRRLQQDIHPPEPVASTVVFLDANEGVAAEAVVQAGNTILEAAKAAGVQIDHFCGGQCSCGTCKVVVMEGPQNLSPMHGMEEMTLGASGIAKKQRLACQAKVLGPTTVQIPRWF